MRAIKAGALEFLTKPYADADLIAAIEQASPAQNASGMNARARADRLDARIQSAARGRDGGRPAIGQSAEWKDVLRKATQVAATEATVLLQGESGTGKEVVARFIHRASPRKAGPFVAINCAALPDHLLESELFGYERGAFTGAQQPKPGQIELASGGVLFLDEVTEMSAAAQAKLLRVLQEREFQRLGGTRLLKANVRVIAATNRDLRDAVTRGAFREDLYYRLQVFDIQMPPLRERTRDIPLLVEAFLQDIGRAIGRPAAGLTPEAKEMLVKYPLAGQRPGAAQRAGARGDSVRGRANHARSPVAARRTARAIVGAVDRPARSGAPGDREGPAGDGREQGEDRPAAGPHAHAALRPAPQELRHRIVRLVVAVAYAVRAEEARRRDGNRAGLS